MMIKILLGCFIVAVMLFGNVSSYLTLGKIDVCYVKFNGESTDPVKVAIEDYPNYDITGTFELDSCSDNSLMYTKTDASGDDTFSFEQIAIDRWRYIFTDGSGDNVRFGPKQGTGQIALFDYLFDNSGDCSCDDNTADNYPPNIMKIDPDLKWIRSAGIGKVLDFRACAEVVTCNEELQVAINTSYWDCNLDACADLEAILQIEYQGMEVFSADGHCSEYDIDELKLTGALRCRVCESGYSQFKDEYAQPDALVDHKCVLCADYFGDSCMFCHTDGCGQCDDSSGMMLTGRSDQCHYSFCSNTCPVPAPTATPNTFAPTGFPTPCVTSAEAPSPGTPYDCRDDEFRLDPLLNPDYGTRILELPECCQGEEKACECDGNDYENCDVCNEGICSQCHYSPDDINGQYFLYSDGHQCASCGWLVGCEVCNNNGCSQCVGGTAPQYDENLKLWYCTTTIESPDHTLEEIADILKTIANTSGEPYVPSPWMCPDRCLASARVNGKCDCGCEEGDTECQLLDDDAKSYCIACHYNGCDACNDNNQDPTNDYFALTNTHPCLNCEDYFGHACLFCNNWVGCAQCKTGYHLKFDECCQVWYCE